MKRITIQGVPKRKRHRREQIQFILFSQKKKKKKGKSKLSCHQEGDKCAKLTDKKRLWMGPFVVVVHQKDTGVWGESKVYDSSQPTDKVLQGGTVERK